MSEEKRKLMPTVLETKQELMMALRAGDLKSAKYNLLSVREKEFVELMVFGEYTAAQAIKVMDPACRQPQMIGNRMLGNPDVSKAIEELSIQKDSKFMSEIQSAGDMALAKLKYIMVTTTDDVLAAACAKTILDQRAKAVVKPKEKEEGVTEVRFTIKSDNSRPLTQDFKDEAIVIPITNEEHDRIIDAQFTDLSESQAEERRKKLKDRRVEEMNITPVVNPNTGLPYKLVYEGIDAYTKKEPGEE
jgi:hypothetical protein